MSGSIGIITAIGVSSVLGFFLLLGLLFSIQDYDGTVNAASGQPVLQIFLDTCGSGGAIALMVIIIVCMFLCGYVPQGRLALPSLLNCYIYLRTFSVTSNSRMMYAFSRDGAIPGSGFWHHVSPRTQSPIRTGTQYKLVHLDEIHQ